MVLDAAAHRRNPLFPILDGSDGIERNATHGRNNPLFPILYGSEGIATALLTLGQLEESGVSNPVRGRMVLRRDPAGLCVLPVSNSRRVRGY